MSYELEIIGRVVLDAGLWKLYLAAVVWTLSLIMNITEKKKGKLRTFGIIGSVGLLSITVGLIIIAKL